MKRAIINFTVKSNKPSKEYARYLDETIQYLEKHVSEDSQLSEAAIMVMENNIRIFKSIKNDLEQRDPFFFHAMDAYYLGGLELLIDLCPRKARDYIIESYNNSEDLIVQDIYKTFAVMYDIKSFEEK